MTFVTEEIISRPECWREVRRAWLGEQMESLATAAERARAAPLPDGIVDPDRPRKLTRAVQLPDPS